MKTSNGTASDPKQPPVFHQLSPNLDQKYSHADIINSLLTKVREPNLYSEEIIQFFQELDEYMQNNKFSIYFSS